MVVDFSFCQGNLVDIIYIYCRIYNQQGLHLSHDQKSCCSQDLRREYFDLFLSFTYCLLFFSYWGREESNHGLELWLISLRREASKIAPRFNMLYILVPRYFWAVDWLIYDEFIDLKQNIPYFLHDKHLSHGLLMPNKLIKKTENTLHRVISSQPRDWATGLSLIRKVYSKPLKLPYLTLLMVSWSTVQYLVLEVP